MIPAPPTLAPTPAPPPTGRLTWRRVLVASIVALAVSTGGGLAVVAVTGASTVTGWVLVTVLTVNGLACLAGSRLVVPRGQGWRALGLRPTHAREVLLGAAVGVGFRMAVVVALALLSVAGVPLGDPQEDLFDLAAGGAPLLLMILLVGGVFVPFAEEVLFRGVWYQGLRAHTGFLVAAVLSALVFAVAHGFSIVLPVAFGLGLVNAWLFRRTDSLWPAVAAHAANNILAFVTAAAVL